MKHKVLLIGAGGHCKVVLDLLQQSKDYQAAGIIDKKTRVGEKVLGVPVAGTDADLLKFFKKGIKYCFIAVGSVGDPSLRAKLFDLGCKAGFSFPNLVHPKAIISSHASLGEGNYIAPGAIINAGARIGDHCIINTGVIIEHDCSVGDFVHIASGAVLSGNVSVGKNTHLGTGVSVIQGIKIGSNSVVGAGSVVVKDIASGVIAFGNPCKFIKKNG